MDDPSIDNTKDPKGDADLYKEGSLVTLATNTGYNEFGMVLKVIPNRVVVKAVPEADTSSDFGVIGTYHLGEIAELANLHPDERPTLYLLPARILNRNRMVLIPHDDSMDDGTKQRVIDTLKEIASEDDTVNDRINDLLNMSYMTCLSRSFIGSRSYEDARAEMEKFMTDVERGKLALDEEDRAPERNKTDSPETLSFVEDDK